MRVFRDNLGIPRLSRDDVERVAEHFLSTLARYALNVDLPLPTNLGYILRDLKEGSFCTFSHDGHLGYKPNGEPCLGTYSFSRQHLTISKDLERTDPRYVFTCAHEIGHFFLHSKVQPQAFQEQGEVEIRDSARDFVVIRSDSVPRTIMEWQANRFAASILMPRITVQTVLAKVQRDLGISRRGKIWLDHQKHIKRDFYRTVQGVAQHYNVSQAVVQMRLRELNLIDTSSTYGLQRIYDSDLETALRQLYQV
ncbi:ImmA/IrrE family metallo-endopeptidase [Longimicrobium terrae]|nr:ImmA/IrrE family metallo-endopeptidase [Longimicrobium terrae]